MPCAPQPMDEYLSTAAELADISASRHMVVSTGPYETSDMGSHYPMAQLRVDLQAISQAMFTKADAGAIEAFLKGTIWAEPVANCQDITSLQGRVTSLEGTAVTFAQQHTAAEIAATRQGNMLLDIRRQVEDLNNRGSRCNIRIHGLPDSIQREPLEATLQALFNFILGNEDPENSQLDWVHWALHHPRQDETLRDVICCVHSFQQK
ncbi:Hypothetical predicted protein [Pelobates cultripes]|uniref:Uncharacterized protein n=1 Tax=Pelobates cultripes TaxID=61616 RepID=A0AAD1VJL4_PELCU|nr:Hypothetical predicted protein [Pelobates cultripes]